MFTRACATTLSHMAAGGIFFLPAVISLALCRAGDWRIWLPVSALCAGGCTYLLMTVIPQLFPHVAHIEWWTLSFALSSGAYIGSLFLTCARPPHASGVGHEQEDAIIPALFAGMMLILAYTLHEGEAAVAKKIYVFAFLAGGIATTAGLNWIFGRFALLSHVRQPTA